MSLPGRLLLYLCFNIKVKFCMLIYVRLHLLPPVDDITSVGDRASGKADIAR